MPTVRFSRDKRGYEYVYLVHTPTRRGKPGRTRVLYWYRTPPGVRIGRSPFDEDVQRLLEKQNPGVTFDWPTITSAQIPPPDMTEYWRERRRAEKAAKQERRAAEAAEAADAAATELDAESNPPAADAVPTDETESTPEGIEAVGPAGQESDAPDGADDEGTGEGAAVEGAAGKRRRRRRGGRRRRGAAVTSADGSTNAEGDVSARSAPETPQPESADDASERPDSASEEA